MRFQQIWAMALLMYSSSNASQICGSIGFLNQPPYFTSSSPSTYYATACGKLCEPNKACQSYAVGTDTCMHYADPLATILVPSSSSPWTLYDRDCNLTDTKVSTAAQMGHTRNPHRVSDGRARAKLEIRQTDPLEAFDKDTGTPEEDIKPDEPKTSIPANSFNQDGANFLKSDVQPDEVTASVSENSFNRNEANFLEDDMKPDEDQTTMPEDSFNQDDANTLKDDTKPDEASSLDSANTPGKWNTGAAPRCPGQPNNYHPQLKPGARPASANGCGSKNNYKVVPDFSFGPCCDAHDYCYDDCGQTFEACNYKFRDCMDQKCGKVDHWYSKPVYAACIGAADVYSATVEGSFGSKKFKEYNNERCQCVP